MRQQTTAGKSVVSRSTVGGAGGNGLVAGRGKSSAANQKHVGVAEKLKVSFDFCFDDRTKRKPFLLPHFVCKCKCSGCFVLSIIFSLIFVLENLLVSLML